MELRATGDQPSLLSFGSAAWRIATLYFLLFAARGLIIPFLNIYLASVGFTGSEIGVLISLSALVQLLATPTLNWIADRQGQHRWLFYGLVASNAIASFALAFSPVKAWLVGVVLVRDSSDMPNASLLSQLTITWLAQHGRSLYGRFRAFGSLGWAASTFISGAIFAAGGYVLLFVVSGVANLIALTLGAALPARTVEREARPQQTIPRPTRFYLLNGISFLFYVGMTAVAAFSFLYFKQDLGADNATIGYIASLGALTEIPAMLILDRLLRRANLLTLLIIGTAGSAAIWFVYTLLQDATPLLPLMVLRGTFFSLQNLSLVLLIARMGHPANAATNQAITQITIPGLAVLLTGALSGWIVDNAGLRTLLQLAALLSGCSALLLLLLRRPLTVAEG